MKLCRSIVVFFPQRRNVSTRREQRLQSPAVSGRKKMLLMKELTSCTCFLVFSYYSLCSVAHKVVLLLSETK